MAIDPVSLAITVALNVATMAMQASQRIEGPRLSDLKTSTADYGTPLVQFYGTKRLECPCIYAEDLREVKTTSKTKGGKYDQYKYYGTWASFIADHEIDGVLQLLLDRHIAFDRTGTGPVDPNIGTVPFRVHKGTETQSPDRRLLAKIEEREGPGTCPAYLGVAYMVFEEVPLEYFGNRLPQVSVLATRNVAPFFPYVSKDGLNSLLNSAITPDSRRLITTDNFGSGHVQVWDLITKSLIIEAEPPISAGREFAVVSNTQFYVVSGSLISPELWLLDIYGGGGQVDITFEAFVGGVQYAGGGLLFMPLFPGDQYFVDAGGAAVPCGFNPTGFATTTEGGAVVVGPVRSGGNIGINVNGATTLINTGYDSDCCIEDNGDGQYFVYQTNAKAFLIDKETLTITNTSADAAGSASGASLRRAFNVLTPGDQTVWVGFSQWDTRSGELNETVNPQDWKIAGSTRTIYDKLNDAIISEEPFTGTNITWRLLNRATGGGWTLGDICANAAELAGMSMSAFDFSDLDQLVPGYAWTQGPAAQIAGPLLDLYDSDIRPHGFIQQGLKRGQPLTGDILTPEWMVRESRGEDPTSQPLYSIPITAETDLPRRIFATFADPNMDEQPNTAVAQRNAPSVKTDREQAFDLQTLRIEPDDIQPLLERALRRWWVGATKPQFILTPLEIRIEPGDVRMLQLEGGELLRCRNTRMIIRANRMIDTEWEVDGESPAVLPDWQADNVSPLDTLFPSPGGFTYGRDPETVLVTEPTVGFVIDTGLLADSYDNSTPFILVACGPSGEGFWPGTSVWASDFGTVDTYAPDWESFVNNQGATFGFIATPLGAAATDVIDEASVLTVLLPGGQSLVSVTEDELLASQSLNQAVVGDEIIQFRDATQISTAPVRFELTGLIRGCRGTEWAVADHVSGEQFLLTNAQIKQRLVGASEIGDTDYYRFVTLGANLDETDTRTLEFEGNANRPLAPAHVALVRNTGTGDWAITWQRRTRIGGSTVDGQDVPLGESSELYRVKILNGVTVERTIEVTAEAAAYTAAEQTADWGSGQTSLSIEVVQVSPTLSLEGFATAASA